ncbi:endospore germination permease [Bacillus sp. FJAT-42315]|uniref:endospore germination permease n=1 Tax=Bacillus sp. FJAT-42315 TaxID=2014077 RepID=UPI000C23BDE4|nr:endospore germination permease [Bacillus sp. FJAT-42315]
MVTIYKPDAITPLQLILLAMTAIGLKNHVFAISPLVSVAGRDAWMSVLLTMVLTFMWVPLLFFIHKKTNNRPLIVWLSEVIGDKATKLLVCLLILYLLFMCGIALRETIVWTTIAYMPETPPLLLTILFLFTCWYLAKERMQTLNILNVFLLFFIIIFGFFVAIANFQFKNHSLLLPVLEHGISPVLNGVIFQASGMVEIFIFLLLQHKLNTPLKFRHFAVVTLLLTALTLGPLIGAIVEFGPQEAKLQRFPPFEEWGLVSIGKFFEHVDFLSIYQWLSGVFIRITLLLFLIKELLPIQKQKKNLVLFLLLFVIGAMVLAPITDFQFNSYLRKYVLPTTFWFFFSFSILVGVITMFQTIQKRRGVQ